MDPLSRLLSSLALFAWPGIFLLFMARFSVPLKNLIDSARERKFTIKVAGNELTMEEFSEQQRALISDLQSKVAEMEGKATASAIASPLQESANARSRKLVLWVDDRPRNNSFLVESLQERGIRVDTALTTEEGMKKFRAMSYDYVISDMARPEGERAGITLAREIRKLSTSVPIYIFCGRFAARTLRGESLEAGINDITSSATTLMSHLLSSQP